MAEELIIAIDALRVRARIGVAEQERVVGADFEVSVRFAYPPALEAAVKDELELTVNYAEVVALVQRVMSKPVKLIETACYGIKRELLERFPLITSGEVKVAKLLPPIAGVQLGQASATVCW